MSAFTKNYSYLYDFIYHDKDYGAETALVEALFIKHGTKMPGVLLDFGCGTGRHAMEFQKKNWTVTAVDRSPDMLARANERAFDSGVQLSLATEIPTEKFDAIVSLFAVLNYLEPERELSLVLDRLRWALKPDAVAVFEVWNGVAVPFLSETRKSRRLPGPEGEELLRTTDIRLDWLKQFMDIEFRLFRPPHEEEWFAETHRMYYLTPMQFTARLDAAGFRVIDLLPAYREANVRHDDFNLLYVCKAIVNA